MNALSIWILSIAGVSVLSVLVDLVLPEGSTNKYIKGIFAFVIILIIISPLPKLLGGQFNLDDIFSNESVEIQEDFIYQQNRNKLDALTEMIDDDIKNKGILGVEVALSADIFRIDMQIEIVFVDLSNLVISDKSPNINTKEEIQKSIKKYIRIEEDKIVFNE